MGLCRVLGGEGIRIRAFITFPALWGAIYVPGCSSVDWGMGLLVMRKRNDSSPAFHRQTGMFIVYILLAAIQILSPLGYTIDTGKVTLTPADS